MGDGQRLRDRRDRLERMTETLAGPLCQPEGISLSPPGSPSVTNGVRAAVWPVRQGQWGLPRDLGLPFGDAGAQSSRDKGVLKPHPVSASQIQKAPGQFHFSFTSESHPGPFPGREAEARGIRAAYPRAKSIFPRNFPSPHPMALG